MLVCTNIMLFGVKVICIKENVSSALEKMTPVTMLALPEVYSYMMLSLFGIWMQASVQQHMNHINVQGYVPLSLVLFVHAFGLSSTASFIQVPTVEGPHIVRQVWMLHLSRIANWPQSATDLFSTDYPVCRSRSHGLLCTLLPAPTVSPGRCFPNHTSLMHLGGSVDVLFGMSSCLPLVA